MTRLSGIGFANSRVEARDNLGVGILLIYHTASFESIRVCLDDMIIMLQSNMTWVVEDQKAIILPTTFWNRNDS